MTLDPDQLKPIDRYKILSSLIVPRPIAWVTTAFENGDVNAAPFSFFNVLGVNPPILAFAPGNHNPDRPKDTALNIKRSGEFVVHMVDDSVSRAMVDTAAPLPYGKSELEGLGLTVLPSEKVEPQRIAEAPAAFECTLHSIMEIGQNRLIIGQIQTIHTRDDLFNENWYLSQPYAPIGRMASPSSYCRSDDLFELE